ncbi:MAG: hypothetical protein ACHQ50_13635 [Fimbriimonadales bacterium]
MRYRKWRNSQEPGIPMFATTTVLNFARAFDPPELRDLMAAILVNDCRFYGAALYSFVVMAHHVHVVVRPAETRTNGWLFQRLKSNSAKLLLPHISSEARDQIAQVAGLNRRAFWMEGFRGYPIESEEVFWQKMGYTHENPVRASLVENPLEYRWSSAQFVQAGLLDPETGLDPQPILDFYGVPPERLSVADETDRREDSE